MEFLKNIQKEIVTKHRKNSDIYATKVTKDDGYVHTCVCHKKKFDRNLIPSIVIDMRYSFLSLTFGVSNIRSKKNKTCYIFVTEYKNDELPHEIQLVFY